MISDPITAYFASAFEWYGREPGDWYTSDRANFRRVCEQCWLALSREQQAEVRERFDNYRMYGRSIKETMR